MVYLEKHEVIKHKVFSDAFLFRNNWLVYEEKYTFLEVKSRNESVFELAQGASLWREKDRICPLL